MACGLQARHAEQIELLSLFTNQERRANEHTSGVVSRFTATAASTGQVRARPTMLFGTIGMGGSDFGAYENDYFDPALVEPAGARRALAEQLRSDVFTACGEVVQHCGDQAFGSGESDGLSVDDHGGLIV
ncbi:MAG: hypothetical protein ACRDRX_25600 [Pseudonocardiaceae bacterium]